MDLDNLQTFHSLFSQWRFTVPDYQRGYAWGEDQWKALMEDLSTLTNDNDHFTGLLVLHENKDLDVRIKTRGIVKDVYDVVDGQQRLTTIVILLNEIRRSMEGLKSGDLPEIARSITDTYLFEPGPGGKPVLKLNLDRMNRDFFAHNVLEVDGVDLLGAEIQSHKNLAGARAYFREYLQTKQTDMGEGYAVWLETLYGKVSNQMKVMVYRLRSEADAGVVFESMNNRGKKPNHLDLVKNYLLFLASKLGPELNPQLTAEINKAWETIFKQLSAAGRPEDEETLLQMHWYTVYDHDKKHWDNEKEKSDLIKRRFSLVDYLDRYDELYQKLVTYVRTLSNAAIAYSDLRRPSRPDAFQIYANTPEIRAEIIKYSQKLLRLGILRPFQPLLIAVRLRNPDSADQYLQVVKQCERYAFRVFAIAERRASGKEAVLFRLGNQFYHGRISITALDETLRRDLMKECDDTLFKNSFSVENPTPWYGKRGLAYFLYEYEEELYKPEEPIINWQTIYEGGHKTIEHILPQTPEESGYWADRFSQEDRERLTHQIGNLTLTEDNSCLGRKPFPEKKGRLGKSCCYANSNLKIERQLAELADWTPEEVKTRQNKLASWALKRWHVEAPPPLPIEGWDRQIQIARQNGVEKEFLALDEVAVKLGLGPAPGKNCMRYKPKYDWTLNAITVYCYQDALSVRLRPHNFPRREGLSEARVLQAFNNQRDWWVPTNQFSGFLSRMEGLLAEADAEATLTDANPLGSTPSASTAEQHFLEQADRLGCGKEFRALLAAARKHPMYPRMQTNWDGIKFTPKTNKQEQLIWLGPDLYFSVVYDNFQRFFGIPAERVQEILGTPARRTLKKEEVPETIHRLDLLFAEIKQVSGQGSSHD